MAPSVGSRVEFCLGTRHGKPVWRPATVTAHRPGSPAVEARPAVTRQVVERVPSKVRRVEVSVQVVDGRDVTIEREVEEDTVVEVSRTEIVEPEVAPTPATLDEWTIDVELHAEPDTPSAPPQYERRRHPDGRRETVMVAPARPFKRGDNDTDLVPRLPSDGILRGVVVRRLGDDVGCIREVGAT